MSAELKAKFTADTSDFNGAVKEIDKKLKGVGKLGQGFGLGKVGGGVGDFLSGIGGLGLATGGLAGAGLGLVAAFKSFSNVLNDREKAVADGIKPFELTKFGKSIESASNWFKQYGRVFAGLPKLVMEGKDSYQEYVLGDDARRRSSSLDAINAAEEAKKAEAKASEELARSEKELARQMEQEQQDRRRRAESVWESIQDFKTNTITTALEKTGSPAAAMAIDLASQFNKMLGENIFTPERVMTQFGDMINARLAVNQMSGVPADQQNRIDYALQSSPELSDRLRRIGGGADASRYGSTTQVFKESLSIEKQQLEVQRGIKEALSKPPNLTTR